MFCFVKVIILASCVGWGGVNTSAGGGTIPHSTSSLSYAQEVRTVPALCTWPGDARRMASCCSFKVLLEAAHAPSFPHYQL